MLKVSDILMGKLKGYQKIKDSISRHGLRGPIIRAICEWDGQSRIVNGYKRLRACFVLDIKPEFIDIIAETPDDYIQLLEDFKEPHFFKKHWANIYARELFDAGIQPGRIVRTVATMVDASERYVRRILDDKYKDSSQQERAESGGTKGRRTVHINYGLG